MTYVMKSERFTRPDRDAWRTGLRIGEELALAESDLEADRGAILVRRGKGDKRREVGVDAWGWQRRDL
jgi:integrase